MAAAESGSPVKTARMRRRALRATWALAAAAWLLVARRPAAGAPWRAAEALLDALDRSAAYVGASASSKPDSYRGAKKGESFKNPKYAGDDLEFDPFRIPTKRTAPNWKLRKFVLPRDYGDDGDPERPLYVRRALMLGTKTAPIDLKMQDYVMKRHFFDTCGYRNPLRINTTMLRDFFARLDAGQFEIPEPSTKPQLRRLRIWRKESDRRAVHHAWWRFTTPGTPMGNGEKDAARLPKFVVAEFLRRLEKSGLKDPLRRTYRMKFKKFKKTKEDKEVKEVQEAKKVKQVEEVEGERGVNEVKEVKEVKGIKGVEEVKEATR